MKGQERAEHGNALPVYLPSRVMLAEDTDDSFLFLWCFFFPVVVTVERRPPGEGEDCDGVGAREEDPCREGVFEA